MINKKTLVAGAAAVIMVAAAGASLVQAQATPAPTQQATPGSQATPVPGQQQRQSKQQLHDNYLAALARRLNVSVDQLRQAMDQARQEVGIPAPGSRGQGPGGQGIPGRGFGFPGGRDGFRGFLGQQATALAQTLGISVDELRQQLPGKTLAEVAVANNRTAQDVINTIVNSTNQQIDQMAQQRGLSAERVTELKQQVSQRTTELVNNFRFPAPRTSTSTTS
jgi:hypothetical protein